MTTIQKIIKYFALILAFTLVIIIFQGMFSVFRIFNLKKEETNKELLPLKTIDLTEISKLDISLKATDLEIKEGKQYKVETNIKKIDCAKKAGILKIEEKGLKVNKNSSNSKIVITIPKNDDLKEIEIKNAAGVTNIIHIYTDELKLEHGAGLAILKNVTVNKKTEIKNGAGKLEVENTLFNNLNLEQGLGEAIINAEVHGKSKIQLGIGNIDLTLIDGLKNYSIEGTKGIGNIKINNKETCYYGDGENKIKINGGIGNLEIK